MTMADQKKQFSSLEQPRGVPTPERDVSIPALETMPEGSEQLKEQVVIASDSSQERVTEGTVSVPVTTAPAQPVLTEERIQLRKDIERVLEEDLGDIYLSLQPQSRKQFKAEGERIAGKIEQLLSHVKVKLVEVVRLIRAWLMLLPGVNAFFIEQEAKIKAEKILALKKSEDG